MSDLHVVFDMGLSACARCGGIHTEPLDWHKFVRPFLSTYKYWATCPTTGDPILMYVGEEI